MTAVSEAISAGGYALAGADPRDAVAELAQSSAPYVIGVRHHSPALAAVVPALLDAADAQVVCIELPTDFQTWLPHLADADTIAPVALAGAGADGYLGFYPFADFSPELAAIRWARARGREVVACDLPLGDPGWSAGAETTRSGSAFADALRDSGSGREGDDYWDRAVEVLAPGCAPEAVRRAALGVGWALRTDSGAGVSATDLAREAHMRSVISQAAKDGRRVAAVVGAFHAPALVGPAGDAAGAGSGSGSDSGSGSSSAAAGASASGSVAAGAAGSGSGSSAAASPSTAAATSTTSLVPYAFDLLDARSGYPAGIRDPRWQQSVFAAGGDPESIQLAAARAITDVCRELRAAGHTAGTGEAAEALRLAGDLARLRALPAPGRGEILEAVNTVLGQGELLGRGRALARALDTVLVGTVRGRVAPGTPRSGLGPSVEAELAGLRLPDPEEPAPREVRLDPLRSELDGRREVLLQRLLVCGAGYGEPVEVTGTGDGTALTSRWRLAWTPGVPVRLDLAGVRGVTAAQAAAGTLRERFRRQAEDGGATCADILDGLRAAASCDLPDLVRARLDDAAGTLPGQAALPELLAALDLLEALVEGHLPGTGDAEREQAATLSGTLLEAAVRALPGLAGSDDPADAAALVALADRAAERHLGLRLADALDTLARSGSPLIQGAVAAARVLLGLDGAEEVGTRVGGWVDAAAHPEGRQRLARHLAGLLTAAAPLLQAAPQALDPLLERVDTLSDRDFLDRLPALRGGFDTLSPAARGRVLTTVAERLGDRPDVTLADDPALLALWTAADTEAFEAVRALGVVLPDAADAAEHSESAPQAESQPRASSDKHRIPPAERWRLLLGRRPDQLSANSRRYARALDELYGTGRGEGSQGLESWTGDGSGDGSGGGRETAFPTAREWADELNALFGADVREEVLGRAAAAGRTDVLDQLDPSSVRPSVELLTNILSLAGGLPEQKLAKLRPLVRRLVAELTRELATRLRPTLTGLATPRPTRRPGGPLDLSRTVRANLGTARRLDDGRTLIVPERPVFGTRARRAADWRLILVVDVSGSMEASVVWSALTAAVLGGVPALSTHFLAFSTEVVDLTDRVPDPLALLLEVRVGGGTHIAAGLRHARSLVTVPSRTIVAVVSDFEEGYPVGGLLGEVRSLAASGVHLIGCAALDDTGLARYSVPIAQQLVAAGMPVAALSPLALARWVGERVRGEAR
ncbi:hypothetical protein ABH920_009952 [Catenulispora sp. EB89]|uniref:DUF5682 family protein n=1 Tax=Catenulispora sp. EB89 TaxID=3156257 RepID=UPI00351624C7